MIDIKEGCHKKGEPLIIPERDEIHDLEIDIKAQKGRTINNSRKRWNTDDK